MTISTNGQDAKLMFFWLCVATFQTNVINDAMSGKEAGKCKCTKMNALIGKHR